MIGISSSRSVAALISVVALILSSTELYAQQSKVYRICDDKGCRSSDENTAAQAQTEINGPEEIVWRGEDLTILAAEAQSGNPHSTHKLGQVSQFGLGGIAKDLSKAAAYYQKSAEAGYGWASFRLAELLGPGKMVTQQRARYVSLMLDAAGKRVPYAMHNAGTMYQSGNGVPKHIKEAVRWYEASAAAGVAESRLALSLLYLNGWDGEKARIYDGFKLLTRAAESGQVEAKFTLARVYQTGFRDIPQNMDKAADWFRQAARDGHPEAKAELKDLEEKIKLRDEYRQKMQEKQMEIMGSMLNAAVTSMLSPPTISCCRF